MLVSSENIRHSHKEVYHDTHTQSNTVTMVALGTNPELSLKSNLNPCSYIILPVLPWVKLSVTKISHFNFGTIAKTV